jgi:hypothetical protein
MPDEPKPPDKSSKNAPPSSVKKDDDWGEDWESAFQAEEDMFFADANSGEEDFFIEEGDKTAAPGAPEKELSSSLEKDLGGAANTASPLSSIAAAISFTAILATLKAFLLQKLAQPATLLRAGRQKISSLPLAFRLAVYIAPALLVLVVSASMFMTHSETSGEADHLSQEIPQGKHMAQEQGGSDTPVAQVYPDQARKKWGFPGFIIPVQSETGDKGISFLMIDITLITMLDQGKEPPQEKKNFMRDSIYQFYLNRPQDELHHFSLARGEMNRKLKDWLLKQWPEAPIESIIFNRYFFS